MLGKELRKLDYWMAILRLAAITIGTILAGVFGGWRSAGLVGLLLFVVLDGLSCMWTILTRSMSERIHEELDADERDRFIEKTRDNPTLR